MVVPKRGSRDRRGVGAHASEGGGGVPGVRAGQGDPQLRAVGVTLSRMIPLPESMTVLCAPPARFKAGGAHRASSAGPEPGDLAQRTGPHGPCGAGPHCSAALPLVEAAGNRAAYRTRCGVEKGDVPLGRWSLRSLLFEAGARLGRGQPALRLCRGLVPALSTLRPRRVFVPGGRLAHGCCVLSAPWRDVPRGKPSGKVAPLRVVVVSPRRGPRQGCSARENTIAL